MSRIPPGPTQNLHPIEARVRVQEESHKVQRERAMGQMRPAQGQLPLSSCELPRKQLEPLDRMRRSYGIDCLRPRSDWLLLNIDR